MLQLSIESINSRAPYNIQLSDDGSFCFTTDEAQTYEIGFVEDHMMAIENAYQFFLMPKSDANEQKDEKMQQTVTAIIEEFFSANDVLLDYICDTKDGRQAARNRLFQQWFNQYPKRHLFTLRTMKVEFDGVTYYASAIIRNDNPAYSDCMTAIDAFEKEMQDKLI
ncbi:MAG: hypothetical protein IJ605_00300 [Prevotella sp.]|nr:hypothetical protein [Prevotella sp.]